MNDIAFPVAELPKTVNGNTDYQQLKKLWNIH